MGGKKGIGLYVDPFEDTRDPRATQSEIPGLSAGDRAAQTGREPQAPEAVSRPHTRLSRLQQVGPPSLPLPAQTVPSRLPPRLVTSSPHELHPNGVFSPRVHKRADNQGPPDRSMNGRKHLLPGLRRKERAELRGRTAETPRPRGVALPSARAERHCGPWRLAVCLARAEGV